MAADRPARVRLGIDVGGTFTDVACTVGGALTRTLKVPSTPRNPARAVVDALARLTGEGGVDPAAIETLAHGTTAATNAVLERKGARVGLLATEGFRDVLEVGRQMRHQMYSIRLEPETPVFLAPGRYRRGIRERIGPAGEVVTPLDEASVHAALDALAELGVESVAVALLFSFLNPAHEHRVRALIAARYPELEVSVSHEVDPAFREYERTAVTAFDAYIKPVVRRYLAELESELGALGIAAPLQVMQSRGGLANAAVGRERPVRLFLSGPAAGVIGGQSEGALVGEHALITVDVGGTSCDIALVSGAQALTRTEGVIAGYPVRVPMVDVNAIGAGGGSIAWIDDAGGLRVGPHSAGSEPGPACYGLGGKDATVTDASVVLGYLNPAFFAGGDFPLHPDLAREAVERCVAGPLGLGLEAAAAGIHRVVNAQMAEAIRLVSIGRGFDAREFTLVALGGAGPLHACPLAEELGIRRILVPRHPGVLSAIGLLSAPVEHEVSLAFPASLDGLDLGAVRAALARLDERGAALMATEGTLAGAVERAYLADVCYIGQAYHLEIPLDLEAEDPTAALYRAFLEAHERIHGHAADAPARIVNLRAVHRAPPPAGTDARDGAPAPGAARAAERPLHLPGGEGPVTAAVHRRDRLAPGARIAGPAIVEQTDTTTLITPGWEAVLAPAGVLVLSQRQEAPP